MVITSLGFIYPVVNGFCLLIVGIPLFVAMVHNLHQETNKDVKYLGIRTIALWVLSLTCWLSDKFMCDFWIKSGFPYLHGIWHILIFLAVYASIVLFAFYDVKNEIKPAVICYWPVKKCHWGVPYVKFIN